MKKKALAAVLFLILLFGLFSAAIYIKSDFGHLSLFFLSQDNVSKIELTQIGTYKGSEVTTTLSEREKMIFISMYSKKFRLKKSSEKFDEKSAKPYYFTVYLKPFGKIKVKNYYTIGNTLYESFDEKYEVANFNAFYFYLNKINNSQMPAEKPPRVLEVQNED